VTDLVEDVRRGIAKFEHETACGLIAVETLAVQREVLVKLCDEIERLRQAVLAERDAAVKDAERYRYLRNRDRTAVLEGRGPNAGCWIDCETDDELVLLTGEDADAAIDALRGKK
jgi:hypothetical protein